MHPRLRIYLSRAAIQFSQLRLRLEAMLDSPNAALYALLIGVAVTVISTRIAWEVAERERRLQESASAGRIAGRIAETISEYEALLRVTSRVAAPTAINAAEGMHGYLAVETLGRFYGAISYLAFIRRVPQSNLPAYERAMKPQISPGEGGVTSVQLKPKPGVIHYFLESSINVSATLPPRGTDLIEDIPFTQTLRALRDMPDPAGLALMLPHDAKEPAQLETPALVTAVLDPLSRTQDSVPQGFLVLGLDLHRLTEITLATEPHATWQVLLSTTPRAQARAGNSPAKRIELYSSHKRVPVETSRRPGTQQQAPAFGSVVRETTLGGIPLSIQVRNMAALQEGGLQYLPWLVFAGSALITILTLLLFRRIQQARIRAESLARMRGEEAQQNSQRFRDLVESSSDWIWEMDSSYRFTYVSPNTHVLFGIPPQRLIGSRMDVLVPAGGNAQAPFPFPPDKPEPYNSYERKLQRTSGEIRVFESSASIAADERGRFAGLRGIDRDVTEQREIQMQLSTLRDKLSENMRANLMEQLLTGLAHELNQPLSAITTYSQACIRLLEMKQPDLVQIRDAMKSAAGQALLAGDIVKGLRRLTASRSPHIVRIEVEPLIRNAISLVDFRLKARNIALQTRIEPRLPYVWADTVLLTQVCLNLLHNAIDALAEARQRQIDITARNNGNGQVEIAFRDSGVGVDAALAGKIFDTRFTTKSEGMGLGLTISRSIMDVLNGSLTYRPAPGQGSIFTLTLPFKRPAALQARPRSEY